MSKAASETENPIISKVLVFSAIWSFIKAFSSDPEYNFWKSSQVSGVKHVV